MKLFTLNRENEEKKLIRQCTDRNPIAQRKLYEKYAGMMMGVCRRYLPYTEEAEEALSNGFIKVFTHIDRYEFKGSFEGWIRRIMVRECLMYLRSKKHIINYTDDIEQYEKPAEFSTTLEMDSEELIMMIDALPDGYKTVFNLYAIEGYKHHEIAEMLDISTSTSKTQLMRARKVLQQSVAEMEDSINALSKTNNEQSR